MSTEAVLQFREMADGDEALQSRLRELMGADGSYDFGAAAALGGERGFQFTEEEIATIYRNGDSELTEFELEMVSAGAGLPPKDDIKV